MAHSSDFNRIVVAIEVASPNATALDIAAKFAAAMNSELVGLFIENTELVNLASLPFTREVSFRSFERRDFDQKVLERDFKRAAMSAQSTLSKVARQRDLKWRFDIVRDELGAALKSAAQSCDLLVLSEQQRALEENRTSLGVRIVLDDVPCDATLVIGPNARVQDGPVLVVIDRPSAAVHLLQTAVKLAENVVQPVKIVALSTAEDDLNAVQSAIETLELRKTHVSVSYISSFSAAAISAVVNTIDASALVMCAHDNEDAASARLLEIENRTTAPILILRSERK